MSGNTNMSALPTYSLSRSNSIPEFSLPICYDIYLFIDSLQYKDYICKLCDNICKNNINLICGHIYGYKCIDTWYNTNKKCPICFEEITNITNNCYNIDIIIETFIIKFNYSIM